jgi:hypothetical protein
VGAPLVAWSQLQQPVPISARFPCHDQVSACPDAEIEPLQTGIFEGTIAGDGNRYVLLISGASPALINESDSARQYLGRQVRVAGKLDWRTNELYIEKVN